MRRFFSKLVKITRVQHNGWNAEIDNAVFERWQYIYEREDGVTMDVVQFKPRMYGDACWEIYGGQLPDVERFKTKSRAELRMLYLLYGEVQITTDDNYNTEEIELPLNELHNKMA